MVDNKYKTLKWVCEVVQNEELFDTTRYDSITSILNIELSNLITIDEEDMIKKEIGEKFTEVVKMSPTRAAELRKSIDYLNEKKIQEIKNETKAKAEAKGMKKGMKKGMAKAEVKIFEIFSELLEEHHDKDQILNEASKRLNRTK